MSLGSKALSLATCVRREVWLQALCGAASRGFRIRKIAAAARKGKVVVPSSMATLTSLTSLSCGTKSRIIRKATVGGSLILLSGSTGHVGQNGASLGGSQLCFVSCRGVAIGAEGLSSIWPCVIANEAFAASTSYKAKIRLSSMVSPNLSNVGETLRQVQGSNFISSTRA